MGTTYENLKNQHGSQKLEPEDLRRNRSCYKVKRTKHLLADNSNGVKEVAMMGNEGE